MGRVLWLVLVLGFTLPSLEARAERHLRFTHTYTQRFYADRIWYVLNITNITPTSQTVQLRGGVVITDFPPTGVPTNTPQGAWVGPPNARVALMSGVTGPDSAGFYTLCGVPAGGVIGCSVTYFWNQVVTGGGSGYALGEITILEDRGALIASGTTSTRFDCYSNNQPDCRAGLGALPTPIQDSIVNTNVEINGGRPF